ncbi:MAG: S9 family peptidase [Thermoplasmataceae archaeon]|jgi:dipeptidyl aminopeptidase/acylaminoacyl peptidase|nr:MAG: S9 family peptidase [Cuniculiplasma divulgatum]
MNATEAYSIKFATDLSVSGDTLFFVQKYIKNGEYKSCIYRISGSSDPEQITFGESERSPRLVDGVLYYIRYEKEKETLMSMGQGKEPREIASFAKIVDFSISGSDILVVAAEKADGELPFYADRLKYRFNGRGLLRSYYNLYRIGENPVKIYGGKFDVLGVKRNGGRIVIETSEFGDDYSLSDLLEIDSGGKVVKRITGESAEINDYDISEKGRIAFSGHYGLKPWEISSIIFPEEGRNIVLGNDSANTVISDSFAGAKYSVRFHGNDLYAIGREKSSSFIYRISNAVTRLTEEHRNITDYDVSGVLAFAYSTQEHPSIIHFNREYDMNPGVLGKKADVMDMDGGEGFVMFRSKDSPSLVFIHGGPHDAYGHSYFMEFQYMFQNGYNIIFTNPPGSTGYGQEYARACVGDWGGSAYNYVKKFIGVIREKYGINEKLGLTGGSYGGFMTNWIVTQTEMFRAAISERSISNLLSMVGTSDIGFWFNTLELNIERPYSMDGMRKLMELSPISYAEKVKTPTMLITGEEDYRCPIEQAEQFYVALKLNNVETELVRYQGDNHEHARSGVPKNMVDRLEIKLKWFDRYLKN